jgi:hypothetical protein
MREHRVEQTVWDLVHVPMVPPTAHPQILEGICSTSAIDQHRMSIRKWALTLPRDVTTIPTLLQTS